MKFNLEGFSGDFWINGVNCNPVTEIYVAYREAQGGSFIMCCKWSDEAGSLYHPECTENLISLNRIYVAPNSRHKGVGRALMTLLCEQLDNLNLCCDLGVSPDEFDENISSEELIHFYNQFGFVSTDSNFPEIMFRYPNSER